MEEFLKVYNAHIDVKTPIHIGSGIQLNKKEYIYNNTTHKVQIIDINRLYEFCVQNNLENEFSKFMSNPAKSLTLKNFMDENSFNITDDLDNFKKYEVDVSRNENFLIGDKKDIITFVKDPYGFPYVPGSSIKGLFRSALIAYEFENNQNLQKDIKLEIKQEINSLRKEGRSFLQKINKKDVEEFITKNLKKIQKLSGLIISDSDPIIVKNPLTLAQRIDYTKEKINKLPIYKESLRPEVSIKFKISMDSKQLGSDIDINYIEEALDYYQNVIYDYFYKYFNLGDKQKGVVWLGGGVGFLSKTIVYQLFKEEAPDIVNEIFYRTLSSRYKGIYETHHHNLNYELTPHTCKCTYYENKLVEMGKGLLTIER